MSQSVYVKYTGPSMNPTLKVGDTLKVMPYEGSKIKVGDIVVFRPVEGNLHVVHRIVALDFFAIKTRGDNNLLADPYVVSKNRIIGRVVLVQRGRFHIPIYGGRLGLIHAKIRWTSKRMDLALTRILHPVYRWLAHTGLFRNVLRPWINTKVICFNRPDGVEMQLVIGRWVIGRCLPGQNHWRIRRPFRLLIDEAYLPKETTNP